MADLLERSIQIILQNQSPSGAYIASPNFPTYHYSWFRDGAFTAYAMDLVGEHKSAAGFHEWAAGIINNRAEVIERAVSLARADQVLTAGDFLHTRYPLDGKNSGTEDWPNFQLDGFGTWLWALAEHLRLAGSALPAAWQQAAGLVAGYLAALWERPCYDCWEEFPDRIHAHTLAAIHGGLKAHMLLAGQDQRATLQAIQAFLRQKAVTKDHFVKFIGSDSVDSSLLGLATPYRVCEPDDPVMRATVSQIEKSLYRGGGLHRYPGDSYYGGGEWVLLAGWLGWYLTECGEFERARRLLQWMEAQADAGGNLPEQIPASLNDASYYEPWVQRWGPVANPLLWSHAKYIILHRKLDAFNLTPSVPLSWRKERRQERGKPA